MEDVIEFITPLIKNSLDSILQKENCTVKQLLLITRITQYLYNDIRLHSTNTKLKQKVEDYIKKEYTHILNYSHIKEKSWVTYHFTNYIDPEYTVNTLNALQELDATKISEHIIEYDTSQYKEERAKGTSFQSKFQPHTVIKYLITLLIYVEENRELILKDSPQVISKVSAQNFIKVISHLITYNKNYQQLKVYLDKNAHIIESIHNNTHYLQNPQLDYEI